MFSLVQNDALQQCCSTCNALDYILQRRRWQQLLYIVLTRNLCIQVHSCYMWKVSASVWVWVCALLSASTYAYTHHRPSEWCVDIANVLHLSKEARLWKKDAPPNRHRHRSTYSLCDVAHQMNNTQSFQQTHNQQRNSSHRKRVKPLRRQFFANFYRKTFDLFRIFSLPFIWSAIHMYTTFVPSIECTQENLSVVSLLSMNTCLSFSCFLLPLPMTRCTYAHWKVEMVTQPNVIMKLLHD